MEVEAHRVPGNGFQEVIYQRALVCEMKSRGQAADRELEMKILYKGEDVGKRRVGFFVEAEIMGEVKALILFEGRPCSRD